MNLGNYEATQIKLMNENLNNNNFYIKRDDLLPVSFGGNKARKAILFFEDLKVGNFDCVVTYGSSSSNHCRVIANMAAANEIPCYIISPSESSNSTYNSKMTELFSAIITYCPVTEVSNQIDQKLKDLRARGYNPYFIQGGGHGNFGTQAYVSAYKEIIDYEKSSGIHFDYIFHTSGTGTTQAGLICGKLIYGGEKEIVGISNARRNPYGGKVVLDSVNEYLKSQGIKPVTEEVITFLDDYVLNGYGSHNEQILQTVKNVLTYDFIPLDTTYTGKAFWGMKEYVKKNQIKEKEILFIHTGGTPLFFNDLGELKNER
ncbi:1-aminocyclopropane-1-carboxylate deaminase/D-cysteine desulfhydrase [Bacillus sp. es.036]|uniref:1-aminocyclopropane-1-carboxylate deaminase/D-cysteine desulfhydrase n=1 Tax=Bacillus sp. es.036 TaxID=1761764 RepID=UPI000BF7E806|nr:pyridoxal-phosphate dependent enzyme [Bacillus sp. es.036]PFG15095.1 D-cysteine desulfhydrase [Bacillus sp. es.036]